MKEVTETNEKMIELSKGDRIHELWQLWEKGQKQAINGYLNMGKAIHYFKQEKLWRYDLTGTGVLSFATWVKQTLHISPAQAHRLEQIYKTVGELLEKESIPIDISKVTLLLPYLEGKTEEEKLEMIEGAAGCTVEDVKNNIKDMEGENNNASDVCTHQAEYIETIYRCKKCGKWFKEYPHIDEYVPRDDS